MQAQSVCVIVSIWNSRKLNAKSETEKIWFFHKLLEHSSIFLKHIVNISSVNVFKA